MPMKLRVLGEKIYGGVSCSARERRLLPEYFYILALAPSAFTIKKPSRLFLQIQQGLLQFFNTDSRSWARFPMSLDAP